VSAIQDSLANAVEEIAAEAGRAIMSVYTAGDVRRWSKTDASPLTEADLRAQRVIADALARLTPELPMLSEEAPPVAYAERSRWARYWLVDPLDGTREFLARNGEFTVNIALIDGHSPALGVVNVPVSGHSYLGIPGQGAWRRQGAGARHQIQVRSAAASPVRVVGSRSHRGASLDAFLARLQDYELIAVGSALKFCLVAEGAADVYPRLGPTSEWDTAAAQAVVTAAGGQVRTLSGEPLAYNGHDGVENPHFLCYGDESRDWLALLR
jgi:3'(2'), 5'-bisphosphate nucleotidase